MDVAPHKLPLSSPSLQYLFHPQDRSSINHSRITLFTSYPLRDRHIIPTSSQFRSWITSSLSIRNCPNFSHKRNDYSRIPTHCYKRLKGRFFSSSSSHYTLCSKTDDLFHSSPFKYSTIKIHDIKII